MLVPGHADAFRVQVFNEIHGGKVVRSNRVAITEGWPNRVRRVAFALPTGQLCDHIGELAVTEASGCLRVPRR
jgi:hypothetical protein